MAAPLLSFTSSLGGTERKPTLILKDTTDYTVSGTVVINRTWYLTDADGKTTSIIDSVGETTHKLLQDSALLIKLSVNTDPLNEFAGYAHTINVLAMPFLDIALYDIDKALLDKYKQGCPEEYGKLVEKALLVNFSSRAALRLISTDLKSTQLALDMGNLEASQFKLACECQ